VRQRHGVLDYRRFALVRQAVSADKAASACTFALSVLDIWRWLSTDKTGPHRLLREAPFSS